MHQYLDRLNKTSLNDTLRKNSDRTNRDFYVERIAIITSLNGDEAKVNFIENVEPNNYYATRNTITCKILQHCDDNGGSVHKYQVGQKVVVRFTDINYSSYFNNKQSNNVFVDMQDDGGLYHSLSNAYIDSPAPSTKAPPINNGYFAGDLKLYLDPDDSKISLANNDADMYEILTNFLTDLKNAITNDIVNAITNTALTDSLGGQVQKVPNVNMQETIQKIDAFLENFNKLSKKFQNGG